MMKKVFALVALSICISAKAQVDFGLRAGMNFTDMNLKGFGQSSFYNNLANGGQDFGYHAGIYAKLNLLLIKLQPELLYTRVSGSLEATDMSGKKVSEDIGINRFDIPMLAVFGLGPVRLGLGPVYSYQFSSVSDVFDDAGVNNSAWNAQLLAGLELGKIQLDVRYEFGLSSSLDYLSLNGIDKVDVKANPSQVIVALGYQLF
jgi:hypothetical protein